MSEYFLLTVEPLSNLRGQRDFSRAHCEAGINLRPVLRPEIQRSLQLILGQGGRAASEEQVVDFLRFTMYRGIDLNDIWIAARDTEILWAILPVVSPGRTMLLFTPSYVPAEILDTVICPLVERVLEHFGDRAVDLAQVLLDPAEARSIRLFEQCSFERLAELIYLDREVRRAHDAPLPPRYSWEVYSATTHDEFARTISRSYAGSLDCPSLNGRRDVQDVIAGHKAAGEFDPKLWFLLREGGDERGPSTSSGQGPSTSSGQGPSTNSGQGVLLLNRSPRTDAVELVYLGLAPEARGRGLGDAMIKHALASAALVGARRLTLAVDSRNTPALKLYHRNSLSRVCSRVALLRDLRRAAPANGEAIAR